VASGRSHHSANGHFLRLLTVPDRYTVTYYQELIIGADPGAGNASARPALSLFHAPLGLTIP
jgi:hypothetical protein